MREELENLKAGLVFMPEEARGTLSMCLLNIQSYLRCLDIKMAERDLQALIEAVVEDE